MAAIAPGVTSKLSTGRGVVALAEYSRARFARSFSDPRIEPYVSFMEDRRMFRDLFSEMFWRSSMLIEAAHVSAILYFAVVSWVSKYLKENEDQRQSM